MLIFKRSILPVMILSIFFSTSSQARDDRELWTELRWKKPLLENLTLQGASSVRFRDDMSEFYKHFDEIGLSGKAAKWLKFEAAYHFDYSQRLNGDGVYEHRPFASVSPIGVWNGIELENRNRFESRHFNGTPDDFRYRNRLKARFVEPFKKWGITPHISDEIFYGRRAAKIGKNRFICGFEKSLSDRVVLDVYYVLESNKTGLDWKEFSALALALQISF